MCVCVCVCVCVRVCAITMHCRLTAVCMCAWIDLQVVVVVLALRSKASSSAKTPKPLLDPTLPGASAQNGGVTTNPIFSPGAFCCSSTCIVVFITAALINAHAVDTIRCLAACLSVCACVCVFSLLRFARLPEPASTRAEPVHAWSDSAYDVSLSSGYAEAAGGTGAQYTKAHAPSERGHKYDMVADPRGEGEGVYAVAMTSGYVDPANAGAGAQQRGHSHAQAGRSSGRAYEEPRPLQLQSAYVQVGNSSDRDYLEPRSQATASATSRSGSAEGGAVYHTVEDVTGFNFTATSA